MMNHSDNEAKRPQYPIESVDNALRILLLLQEKEQLRLKDVADHLEVASSTAHRLMAMLVYRGFIQQHPDTRAYHAGPMLVELAYGMVREVDVRTIIKPFMEQLAADVGETIHLGRLDGTSVSFIDAIESPKVVRVSSRLGAMYAAHCTSSGKACLSVLTDAELQELYPDEELPGLTSFSVMSRSELIEHLRAVRRTGYAVSDQESEVGVASVAVPLGRYRHEIYALVVSLPRNRMTSATQHAIVAQMQQVCDQAAVYFQ